MKGDTILNGVSYNKIYISTVLSYWANDTVIHSFVRQDTALKKVFIRYPYSSYSDTSEYLLYDFSRHASDTVFIKFISDGQIHRFGVQGEDTAQFNFDDRRYISVIPIDSCFSPVPMSNCLWGGGCDLTKSWTEGIGSNFHPFYIELMPDTCGSSTNYYFLLECFWHNGQYVFGGTFCDYSTGITHDFLSKSERVFVVPNPVTNQSVLDLSGKNISSLEVFNILGELVKKYSAMNGFEIIRASEFESGNYLVNAISNTGYIHHSRFTVVK
jgi:hypothetical protein